MVSPPAGEIRGNSRDDVMAERDRGEYILIGNGMLNIRWPAPYTSNNRPNIRWPTYRMYKMNRLVRILYRNASSTKRCLKLGEHPKDMIVGPLAGRIQGNPRDDVTPNRPPLSAADEATISK